MTTQSQDHISIVLLEEDMEIEQALIRGEVAGKVIAGHFPTRALEWPGKSEIFLCGVAAENGYDLPLYPPLFIPFAF